MSDYDTIQAMLKYGGSFIVALAKAWQAADLENQRKLKHAFPEYWSQYKEMVEQEKRSKARLE
jgi:hypothetical protein